MTDPYDDPRFKRWADERKATVIKAVDASATFVSILSPPFDFEHLSMSMALELGSALLLGKPIILCVENGTVCPRGLSAAAEEIVEMDQPFNSPANLERLRAAITRVEERKLRVSTLESEDSMSSWQDGTEEEPGPSSTG